MKRGILLIVCILVSLSLILCLCYSRHLGKTNEVVTIIDESDRFNLEEIEDAMSTVKKFFRSFYGCSMEKIWYNDNISEKNIEKYTTDISDRNNVILILCTFKTGDNCPAGLKENTVYKSYQWLLIRDNENSQWRIEENGY